MNLEIGWRKDMILLKNENIKIALILEDDIKTIPNIDLNKEINESK